MKQLCIALFMLVYVQASLGQLEGSLSGTLGPGEYHVIDTISVESGDSLTLLPGTTFNFDGPYPFLLYGTLLAEGTETDSIIFTTDTLANPDRWRGLRFSDSTSSGSRLDYCLIEKAFATGDLEKSFGGGVYCYGYDMSPLFANCTISDNAANAAGGGVYCNRGTPSFINCIISNNRSNISGGGVFCHTASPIFTDCIISGNSAGYEGGGVECVRYCTPTFINCEISDNTAVEEGGGVYSAEGPTTTLTNCTIKGNSANRGGGIGDYESWLIVTDCVISDNAARYGGGVYGYDAYESHFTNCTINDNVAESHGGGVHCTFSPFNFTRCTLSGNSAESYGAGVYLQNIWYSSSFNSTIIAFSDGVGIFFDRYSEDIQFNYCDIFGSSGRNIAFLDDDPSHGPPNIGVLSTTNANDDSCDQYSNIFYDPMFVDTATSDYHLLAGSPCIDAGDGSLSLDPDSTTADIGVFYYHQLDAEMPIAVLPSTHVLYPNWPNPFNAATTIRYNVKRAGQVRLAIFNLLGRKVATLIDDRHLVGSYTISWDAISYPSGVYIYHLEMPGFSASKKMVLLK